MLSIEETFEKFKDELYLELFKIVNMTTTSLIDPCYNPPIASLLKKSIKLSFQPNILRGGGLNFFDYINNKIYKKIATYRLYRDDMVWFLLLTSIYFNNKKKQDSIDRELVFLSTFILLMKYYTSLSNIHMSKFCDTSKAVLALETLSKKALFSPKNKKVQTKAKSLLNQYNLSSKLRNNITNSPIALGLIYIADNVISKYYKYVDFKNWNNTAKLILIYRHRVSQSFKAYAKHYYNIKINTYQSDEDFTKIQNAINIVVNKNTQRLVFIPDSHYKLLMQITSIPIVVLKDMYEIIFHTQDIHETVFKIISIILSLNNGYQKLLDSDSVYEWLTIVKTYVALRSDKGIRKLLLSIIESNKKLRKIYDEKSDSFKHKMIQALGGVFGLSIYNAIKGYGVKITLGMII